MLFLGSWGSTCVILSYLNKSFFLFSAHLLHCLSVCFSPLKFCFLSIYCFSKAVLLSCNDNGIQHINNLMSFNKSWCLWPVCEKAWERYGDVYAKYDMGLESIIFPCESICVIALLLIVVLPIALTMLACCLFFSFQNNRVE